VGKWILGCSGLVFAMVSLGGATRLTRSGLSMVDWKLTGIKLPANDQEWNLEFDKYKLFPEYQKYTQFNIGTNVLTVCDI
jgi:cytochrome c oxidase assembly protein subunit 15